MSAPYYAVRTSASSINTTFRVVETCASWADAMRFVRRLENLKSKPTIRRHGDSWTVRYEPTLIAYNAAS